MTPFSHSTKVINIGSKQSEGFLLIRGREDGSWAINLHHREKASAGCDMPEACYPALLEVLKDWEKETDEIHARSIEIIKSWPEHRNGYRLGWKSKELRLAEEQRMKSKASMIKVMEHIKTIMNQAGWPTETT